MNQSPSTLFANLTPAQKAVAKARALEALERLKQQRRALAEKLSAQLLETERRRCKEFKYFVHKFWSVVEPKQELKWNWHLDVLCKDVEDLHAGTIMQEIVNVPPGTMKSLLCSIMARAWIWSQEPSSRFLAWSYGNHLSIDHNVKLRDIVTSAEFKKLWPKFSLTGDQNAKERFNTADRGWSIATSVGGVGTGEHPDFIFIDDPVSEAQARSTKECKAACTGIDRTLSTRGATREARTLVVMQRFTETDPTAHLLQQGGWVHRCFPMEYVPTRAATQDVPGFTADPMDTRREPGELLWPSLFNADMLKPIYVRLGPYGKAGQMQQQPVPEGGGLFKREWFKFIDAIPKLVRRARGWDTASTEDGGDYTASCRMAETIGLFFIEHAWHDQIGPAGVDAMMRQTAEADGISVVQRELKEPASSGKTVIEARTKHLVGFDHKGVSATGDKVTMAKPLRAQCEAGNVFIVRTGDPSRDAWIEPFISELCSFPTGQFDDFVDAASCAFNAVLLEPVPKEEWVTW